MSSDIINVPTFYVPKVIAVQAIEFRRSTYNAVVEWLGADFATGSNSPIDTWVMIRDRNLVVNHGCIITRNSYGEYSYWRPWVFNETFRQAKEEEVPKDLF